MEELLPSIKKFNLYILITALIITLTGSLYYYFLVSSPELFTDFSKSVTNLKAKITTDKTDKNEATPSIEVAVATPNPSPTYTLPLGPQTYEFTHGDNVKGPKPKSLTLSPLSPSKNANQQATIIASDNSPITNVTITIVSDTLVEIHDLDLSSGTNSDGTWTGSWALNDTIDNRYAARITLTSANGKYDSAMWFVNRQL